MQGPAAAPVQQPVDASCLLSASSFAAQHSRVQPSVSFVGELLLHFVTLGNHTHSSRTPTRRRACVKVAHYWHRRVVDTKCRTNVVGRSNVLTPIIHIIGKKPCFVSNEWSSLIQWVEFSKGRTRTLAIVGANGCRKNGRNLFQTNQDRVTCACAFAAQKHETINNQALRIKKKKANSCAR